MKISTKGRYAMRLMLDIAENGKEKNISLKDISERQDISIKYLEQIVNILCRAGFLKSYRGAQGGYRLTRDLKEYKIGDILRVTEGELAPVSCLESDDNTCPRAASCPTLSFWTGLYDVINNYIDSVTLYDIVKESREMGVLDYCI